MSVGLRCCIVAVVGLILSGCGGYKPKAGVTVKGSIVKGGQPLQVPRRDIGLGSVEVQLVPAGEIKGGGLETAMVAESGAFEMQGAGRGVMPGKYKVVVLQHDRGQASDALNGAFAKGQTPIEVEIPEDKVGSTHDLGVIDLEKYAK